MFAGRKIYEGAGKRLTAIGGETPKLRAKNKGGGKKRQHQMKRFFNKRLVDHNYTNTIYKNNTAKNSTKRNGLPLQSFVKQAVISLFAMQSPVLR